MSSIKKNVASQNLTFCLVNATTGAALTGATVTGYVTKDGTQANAGGTFTELKVSGTGFGAYNYAPTQAETNCTNFGVLATATNAIPVNLDFHTDIVDANGLLEVDVVDWNGTAVSSPATAGIPDVNVKNINNVAAATPGASGGILIAGTNVATTIQGLTLTGAAAVTSTPATAGLTITGGAASTSSGGTAAAAAIVTGGAGAASTNGAGAGTTITAGGTTTVSGNDGVKFTGTGNGNGVTLTHAGSGLDLNAQTTNALQVNATAINAVSTSSVTAVSANIGTTQPLNFTGTAGSALVKSDMIDIASSAVSTSSAQIGVNLVNIAGSAVSTSTAQLGVNLVNWNGTAATSTIPPDAIFIRSGTAQAGGSTTITLDAGASATNNLYQNETIWIRSGTGAGQSNIIASYVGSTKVATVATAWATNPDNTSVFSIISQGPSIASVSGTVNANVVSINSVSASSVTTVNANIGTTQAIVFDANNFQKVDLVDIAGVAVSATTAQLGVNVVNWNNTVVATPATAGIPDINVKNMNNVAATSITTINANQGTTQPINFSGTGSTAYVKADTEQLNAQAVTAAAGVTFPSSVASPTNITAGTITTVTNLTNAATAGDFTSTMKTSITTATNAATTVGITSNRKKGAAYTQGFPGFSASTGALTTGLTFTATISKDGGTPAATANAPTEIGDGQYQIVLTSGEMNANYVFLIFSATGAVTYAQEVLTQP